MNCCSDFLSLVSLLVFFFLVDLVAGLSDDGCVVVAGVGLSAHGELTYDDDIRLGLTE